MAVFLMGLVFLIAMASYSDATFCICNTGLSDTVLQRDIDYACGNGADCSAILQNGACFNPNTVRDHCNYAVNSYYQRRGQVPGSCDFSGTAAVSQTAPASVGSGCVYQSSPSTGGTGGTTSPPAGGTTSPPAGGTPNTGGTTPGTGTGTGGTGTGTGTGTGIGTAPPGIGTSPPGIGMSPPGSTFPGGSTVTPGGGIGLGPSGNGFGSTDDSAKTTLSLRSTIGLISFSITLLLSGLMLPRI